jgi:hypothetical protein
MYREIILAAGELDNLAFAVHLEGESSRHVVQEGYEQDARSIHSVARYSKVNHRAHKRSQSSLGRLSGVLLSAWSPLTILPHEVCIKVRDILFGTPGRANVAEMPRRRYRKAFIIFNVRRLWTAGARNATLARWIPSTRPNMGRGFTFYRMAESSCAKRSGERQATAATAGAGEL